MIRSRKEDDSLKAASPNRVANNRNNLKPKSVALTPESKPHKFMNPNPQTINPQPCWENHMGSRQNHGPFGEPLNSTFIQHPIVREPKRESDLENHPHPATSRAFQTATEHSTIFGSAWTFWKPRQGLP